MVLTNAISQSAVVIITSIVTCSNPGKLTEQVGSVLQGLKLRSMQAHPTNEGNI